MKVYVLLDDPHDEGWNVYGIFSSKDKVDKAMDVFTSVSKYELQYAEFELDSLEKFFDKTDKPRRYTAYSPLHFKLTKDNIKTITWQSISPCGLDSFLQDTDRKNSLLVTNALWLSVFAKDENDVILKGNELLEDVINQPEDERGWKWIEKHE